MPRNKPIKIKQSRSRSKKPIIQLRAHVRSPFVLSLAQPTTPEHSSCATPLVCANLLPIDAPEIKQAVIDVSEDLLVDPKALQCQLEDDRLNFEPTSSATFVHVAPLQESQIPKDLFTLLDLPEEEEILESELVELDDLLETARPHVWMFPSGPQRAMAFFVLFSFTLVLPLHAFSAFAGLKQTASEIEQSGREALQWFERGVQAIQDYEGAEARLAFDSASSRLSETKKQLEQIDASVSLLLQTLPQTKKTYRTGDRLVEAAHALAQVGKRFSDALIALEHDIEPTPVSRVKLLKLHLASTLPALEQAELELASIDADSLPTSAKKTFANMVEILKQTKETFHAFLSIADMIEQLLGAEGTKRYLVVFQNNQELRATGGFIGSFAEIKVHHGLIEQVDIPKGGSYDLQGSLQTALAAPKPLQLLRAKWEFQDGNWFPDFPTSARQLLEFYEDAGGPTVDGVIAVNATFVADLIGLVGPFEMPEYGRVIDEENFLFEAQKIVEMEYDRSVNEPKAFIGNLAPRLIERAKQQSGEQFLSLVDRLSTGLAQKNIQLYLKENTHQKQIREMGWSGEIKQTDGDYLMIVNSNLGGGKTDGVIEEKANLHTLLKEDGSIVHTLTLSRTHNGITGALFTGANNVNYLRVYVPKGSELIETTGSFSPDASLFEIPDPLWQNDDDLVYSANTEYYDELNQTDIFQESGKTVFGSWMQTAPGTTSTLTVTYRLPWKMNRESHPSWFDRLQRAFSMPETDSYSLLIQKQSGVTDRTTTVSFELPTSTSVLWNSMGDTSTFSNTQDVFLGMILKNSRGLSR